MYIHDSNSWESIELFRDTPAEENEIKYSDPFLVLLHVPGSFSVLLHQLKSTAVLAVSIMML